MHTHIVKYTFAFKVHKNSWNKKKDNNQRNKLTEKSEVVTQQVQTTKSCKQKHYFVMYVLFCYVYETALVLQVNIQRIQKTINCTVHFIV